MRSLEINTASNGACRWLCLLPSSGVLRQPCSCSTIKPDRLPSKVFIHRILFNLPGHIKHCRMGSTNIHRTSALLSCAGSSFEDQAIIQPFDLDAGTQTQEHINKFGRLLKCGIWDHWVANAGSIDQVFRAGPASPPMDIPKVYVWSSDRFQRSQPPKARGTAQGAFCLHSCGPSCQCLRTLEGIHQDNAGWSC